MWLCDEFEISFVQRKSYMREPLFVIVLNFMIQIVFLENEMENIIEYTIND